MTLFEEEVIRVPALSGLGKFWRVYNALKVELFGYIKRRFELVKWDKELVQEEGDAIYSGLLDRWREVEEVYGPEFFPRLNGVLYEALFYYCVLKQVALFRQGAWYIREGWMNIEAIEPEHRDVMWLEIVPIFEVVPRLLLVDNRRVAPQVNADFLVLYSEPVRKGENEYPVWFIDVKSSGSFLGDASELERLEWQFVGANYYGGYFQVAYPKRGYKYPKHLEEWLVLPKGTFSIDELLAQAKTEEQ